MRVAGSSKERIDDSSISAACRSRAARRASSVESSLRRTFFQRIFAHSATRSSGAISFACRRSANAWSVPASSTTHLTAMLASMTRVFTARHAPRGGGPPKEFCCRCFVSSRKSAASLSKDGSSSPTRACRRISRCSASAERPCRAALRFSLVINSSSRLRTCRFPAIRPSMRPMISMTSFWVHFVKNGRSGSRPIGVITHL